MTTTTLSSEVALRKPSSNGTASKRRVPSAQDCFSICWSLIRANSGRAGKAAVVKAMIDGHPPYSASARRANNLAWMANFNTLEAESIVSNAVTPYYDLFTSASPLIEIELDTDNGLRDHWSSIVADEFHRFFYGYKGVEFVLWPMLTEFVTFNKSYLFWPQIDDPWFKHRSWVDVMFPDGTGIDPDEWEQFGVRQRFTVSRLWRYLEDGGSNSGWNRSAVLAAIERAVPDVPNSSQSEQLRVEQQLRDCDLGTSTRSEMVKAVSLFVKEFDGKWSWLMVEETALGRLLENDGSLNKEALKKESPAFLFERYGFFDSSKEIIAPFVFEAADDSINSFAGLGRKIQPLMSLKDRFWCETVNGGFLRAMPLLAAQDAGSLQKAGLTNLGYATVLHPGISLQQTNLLADIESSLAILQSLDSLVETNTGIFKPRLEKPRGNPETATAASLRFQNATVLTNSAVNRFCDQMDYFLDEVYRRATLEQSSKRPGCKAAREFQARCKDRGVPLAVLRKVPLFLNMTRVIGNGSPVQRQQSVQAMAPIVTTMGPRGRLAWQKDYTAAYSGQRAVSRYWPVDDQLRAPDFNVWAAEQENALMMQGQKPTIIDGQDHVIHLQEHFKAMGGALSSVQQGGDAMSVLSFLQVGMAHAAEHIGNLQERDQKPWVEALNEVSQQAEQLSRAVQQQQQEQARLQQQAQQQSFEQQLAQKKLDDETQLKREKNTAQMQQRAERHEQDQSLADVRTASEIQRATATVAVDIASTRAKTEAEVEAKKAKAAQATKPTTNK